MPRDLTVRVRADVGAYQKAMSAAAASTDELAQSGLRLQRVGMQISSIGDNLTKNVTLPLALVGGAAVKLASDFDKSFTQMQTLAGVSADAVDGLKESVLDLSGKTGRAPQELADALYFLQSSGLDSADAMDALEVSAKASAVGLGDTATIADAVSSAMLAYAQSGLKAADATDILIATARAGKAEPAELAGQMGRLLPIASELGITFGDVGGAIAALSTKGNNAEQATTQLVNVMGKLLKPSQQAAEALAEVGISTDDIRRMISEQGLLGTLETLKGALGDNGFVKFFEDQQAVQGALSLLGGDLNKTKEIFDQVNDSVGATDNAFATWAESMGAKNARAFAEFQVALIHVGDVLAPIATQVLDFAAGIAEAFDNLPTGAQQAIIALGLIMAAMGPLLSVTGRLITGVGTAMRMLENFALPAGTISGAFSDAAVSTSRFTSALGTLGKAGAVIGILVALRETLGTIDDEVDKAGVSKLENQLLDLAETGEASGATLKRVFAGPGGDGLFGGAIKDSRQLQTDINQLDEALASLEARDPSAAADAFRIISDELERQGLSTRMIQDRFDNYNQAVDEAETTNRITASAVDDATGSIDDQSAASASATAALEAYADALKAQFDPLFGMESALRSNQEAQAALTDAQNALNEAMAAGKPEDVAAAQRDYQAALDKSSGSLLDVQSAQLTLNAAIQRGEVDVATAQQKLHDWAIQAGYTEDQARQMAAGLASAAFQAGVLGAQDPVVAVSTTGVGQASADLNALKTQLDNIPRQVNVVTRVTTVLAGSTNIPMRAGGGDVRAGQAYVVGEKQPELFVPDRNGTIWPSVPPMAVPSPWGGGGGGGGTQTVNETIIIQLDGNEVARAVRRSDRRNGLAGRT